MNVSEEQTDLGTPPSEPGTTTLPELVAIFHGTYMNDGGAVAFVESI